MNQAKKAAIKVGNVALNVVTFPLRLALGVLLLGNFRDK